MAHKIVPSYRNPQSYGNRMYIQKRGGSGGSGGGGGSGFSGASSPEGAQTADPGSTYVQTTNGGRLWYKITGTGNTGWDYQRKSTIGTGSPNGVVIGRPGDKYFDEAADTLYTKESGADTNTGWL